jgi:hypothetical protein
MILLACSPNFVCFYNLYVRFKGTASRDILLQVFSPQAPDNNIRVILNFFASQGAPPVSMTPVAGKNAASINDTGGKLPPLSMTPEANFATSSACVVDTGGQFAASVNTAGCK